MNEWSERLMDLAKTGDLSFTPGFAPDQLAAASAGKRTSFRILLPDGDYTIFEATPTPDSKAVSGFRVSFSAKDITERGNIYARCESD